MKKGERNASSTRKEKPKKFDTPKGSRNKTSSGTVIQKGPDGAKKVNAPRRTPKKNADVSINKKIPEKATGQVALSRNKEPPKFTPTRNTLKKSPNDLVHNEHSKENQFSKSTEHFSKKRHNKERPFGSNLCISSAPEKLIVVKVRNICSMNGSNGDSKEITVEDCLKLQKYFNEFFRQDNLRFYVTKGEDLLLYGDHFFENGRIRNDKLEHFMNEIYRQDNLNIHIAKEENLLLSGENNYENQIIGPSQWERNSKSIEEITSCKDDCVNLFVVAERAEENFSRTLKESMTYCTIDDDADFFTFAHELRHFLGSIYLIRPVVYCSYHPC